ncbi:MAG: cell division protein ZapB [Reyranellaceae bacterium]
MGSAQGVAINELVHLLHSNAAAKLASARKESPELAPVLDLGIKAGDAPSTGPDPLIVAKARLAVTALGSLNEPLGRTKSELLQLANRSSRWRLSVQVVAVVGSTATVGTVVGDQKTLSIIVGAIGSLGSLLTLFADALEKRISPKLGTIQDAYEKLHSEEFKAQAICQSIELAIKYEVARPELEQLVQEANALAERINNLLGQVR